jgi:hypothetical protein
MRYLVGDAGHVQRTYLAVLTASEYQLDNMRAMCEVYLKKYGELTREGARKRGLLNSEWRSAEPHFSFAREMDLLDGRHIERWGVSFGAGRAFLASWQQNERPTELLLYQYLTYDRTFSIPFLTALLEANYDFGKGTFVGLDRYAAGVWEEVWAEHARELQDREPKLPSAKEVKPRTLLHHAAARVRFLNKVEGLGLNIEKLRRTVNLFLDTEDTPEMPNDSFFRIKAALYSTSPAPLRDDELLTAMESALMSLQRGGFASARGLFLLINQRAGPTKAVEWNKFSEYVRSGNAFSVSSSFRRDDFLVGARKPVRVVG